MHKVIDGKVLKILHSSIAQKHIDHIHVHWSLMSLACALGQARAEIPQFFSFKLLAYRVIMQILISKPLDIPNLKFCNSWVFCFLSSFSLTVCSAQPIIEIKQLNFFHSPSFNWRIAKYFLFKLLIISMDNPFSNWISCFSCNGHLFIWWWWS